MKNESRIDCAYPVPGGVHMSYGRDYPQSDTPRKGNWLMTSTGKKYFPIDPRPEDVDIYDVAHHLSLLCRFTGACNRFYSVAEHSVLVSELVELHSPEHALIGLLHDATEAYLGDVGTPLKRHLPEYMAIEDENWKVVADRFGLPYEMPACIKDADVAVFHAECDALGITRRDFGVVPPAPAPKGVNVFGLTPRAAEELFLLRYQELTHGLWP